MYSPGKFLAVQQPRFMKSLKFRDFLLFQFCTQSHKQKFGFRHGKITSHID
jgi:hypothetical protein